MTPIQAKLLLKFNLSPRQSEVAALAAQGLSNPQIADQLCVCEKTVKFHLGYVFKKCSIKNRIQLTALIDKMSKHVGKSF